MLALGTLVLAWKHAPDGRSLWQEVAKTSLQVIAIAVIGGLASLITFSHQQRRLAAAKELEVQRDERTRADELLRSTLEDTLKSYNQVKRIRRLLDADTRQPEHRAISVDVYDQHLRGLVDLQLAFEHFKRSAFKIDTLIKRLDLYERTDAQASRCTLNETYASIEKYLNEVIKEYKEKRHVVAASLGDFRLEALPELNSFIGHKFVERVSDELDEVLEVLQASLLRPLGPPHS